MRLEGDWHDSCNTSGCGPLATLFQGAKDLHFWILGSSEEVHEEDDDCIVFGLANAGTLSHIGSSPNAHQFDQFRFNHSGHLGRRRWDPSCCFGILQSGYLLTVECSLKLSHWSCSRHGAYCILRGDFRFIGDCRVHHSCSESERKLLRGFLSPQLDTSFTCPSNTPARRADPPKHHNFSPGHRDPFSPSQWGITSRRTRTGIDGPIWFGAFNSRGSPPAAKHLIYPDSLASGVAFEPGEIRSSMGGPECSILRLPGSTNLRSTVALEPSG